MRGMMPTPGAGPEGVVIRQPGGWAERAAPRSPALRFNRTLSGINSDALSFSLGDKNHFVTPGGTITLQRPPSSTLNILFARGLGCLPARLPLPLPTSRFLALLMRHFSSLSVDRQTRQ